MLASRIVAPGRVEVAEVDKPSLQNGNVLVKMVMGALCGTDLHLFEQKRPASDFPMPPGFSGHECVGIVEEAGGGDVRVGDRVFIAPRVPRGFAQFATTEPTLLLKLPDHADLDKLVFGQQLGTVIYCCRRLPNVLDMDVAVLGQGPAGLFFTALLSKMGARKIIGIDIVPHLLETARQMGATHVVDASKDDPGKAVAEITNGVMADLAVEAVGLPETINEVPDLIHDRGHLVLFGIPPKGGGWEFNYEKFFRKHPVSFSSSRTELEANFASTRLAMQIIAENRIDVTPMMSHRIPLSRIDHAYDLALHKKDGAVKVLIDLQS
ncbi:MAG: zinc-binding dehydrogenase [Ardenticatenaceae bacterium]|nr:zinc-binding dehydrogenase [Ardenticatenaceae bacterium]HBY93272.1 hypothetical protein [Chloroflexota bacterium]